MGTAIQTTESINLTLPEQSIHVALNMAYYGSDGNTHNEIAKALGYPSKNNVAIRNLQFIVV